MKHVVVFSFLMITMLVNAQSEDSFLIDNTFSAKLGDICEETPEPDPCAGQELYLVLEFGKEQVRAFERYTSSCEEITIVEIGNYKWSVLEEGELQIHYTIEAVEYTLLKDVELRIEDQILRGIKTQRNANTSHYIFKPE